MLLEEVAATKDATPCRLHSRVNNKTFHLEGCPVSNQGLCLLTVNLVLIIESAPPPASCGPFISCAALDWLPALQTVRLLLRT